MLITVLIEELQPGDILCPDADSITLDMVCDAMAVPTRTEQTNTHLKLQQQAKRVVRPVNVGRLYVRVTMGTYVIVSRRKGTPVSVDRNEENEPEDGSAAVVEAVLEAAEYADMPADFVDEGGQAFRSRRPVNYARSQFDQVADTSEFYRIQVRSDVRNAHTKWMNVTPAQFAAIREIMAGGEES